MKSETNRIEVSGNELGEVSEHLIRMRAQELAISDGRDEPGPGDMSAALDELRGVRSDVGPEEDAVTSRLNAWDEDPGASGTQAPRIFPEDDQNLTNLVEEGLEEADHDSRLEAGRQREDEE